MKKKLTSRDLFFSKDLSDIILEESDNISLLEQVGGDKFIDVEDEDVNEQSLPEGEAGSVPATTGEELGEDEAGSVPAPEAPAEAPAEGEQAAAAPATDEGFEDPSTSPMQPEFGEEEEEEETITVRLESDNAGELNLAIDEEDPDLEPTAEEFEDGADEIIPEHVINKQESIDESLESLFADLESEMLAYDENKIDKEGHGEAEEEILADTKSEGSSASRLDGDVTSEDSDVDLDVNEEAFLFEEEFLFEEDLLDELNDDEDMEELNSDEEDIKEVEEAIEDEEEKSEDVEEVEEEVIEAKSEAIKEKAEAEVAEAEAEMKEEEAEEAKDEDEDEEYLEESMRILDQNLCEILGADFDDFKL